MESEGDGFLLDLDCVAEGFDLIDNPDGECLGPGDPGKRVSGFADRVDGAAAVDVLDLDGDLHWSDSEGKNQNGQGDDGGAFVTEVQEVVHGVSDGARRPRLGLGGLKGDDRSEVGDGAGEEVVVRWATGHVFVVLCGVFASLERLD